MIEHLAETLDHAFVAQYEGNLAGEPANVTDGLFAIARALDRVADAIRESKQAVGHDDA